MGEPPGRPGHCPFDTCGLTKITKVWGMCSDKTPCKFSASTSLRPGRSETSRVECQISALGSKMCNSTCARMQHFIFPFFSTKNIIYVLEISWTYLDFFFCLGLSIGCWSVPRIPLTTTVCFGMAHSGRNHLRYPRRSSFGSRRRQIYFAICF